jgi:hypothetical protein
MSLEFFYGSLTKLTGVRESIYTLKEKKRNQPKEGKRKKNIYKSPKCHKAKK